MVWDFVEKIFIGYGGLVRTYTTNYCNRLMLYYQMRICKVSISDITAFTSTRTITRYILMKLPKTNGEAISSSLIPMLMMKSSS